MKEKIVKMSRNIGYLLGIISRIIPHQLTYMYSLFVRGWATGRNKQRFKKFGKGSLLSSDLTLVNPSFISVGDHTSILAHGTIEIYNLIHVSPSLNIGSHVFIGDHCHITCANKITICDGTAIGRYVLITDNAHGTTTYSDMNSHPVSRKLVSKGEVIIQKHVWVGDKVTILPGVKIGEGAIIGAGSVVSRDVPAYGVAVGNPARVIKIINQ